ncbi:hypothetical protein B0H66DRAFT_624257 [Apodospora peruviana]|uniref:Microbial-type PARG catalytic domain-containing protein n=1 Tax=Apodospora peruviana TaxID=516989 RepID=A0AAE0I6J1_9PEZI|nr:hypothetical protein B0H66DRAFT_624257 [Apodospora peruviana]
MWKNKAYQDRRKALANIAKETKELTPSIAAQLPSLDPTKSECLELASLPPLTHRKGSGLGTAVRVSNEDSLDAAIKMPSVQILNLQNGQTTATAASETDILDRVLKATAANPSNLNVGTAARVSMLNMASEKSPGGGWLRGSSAQEEAICFRSTLAGSLHRRWYPISVTAGLYTRDVVVFRSSMGDGHKLLMTGTPDVTAAAQLPVVSILSVARIRRPAVKRSNGNEGREKGTDDGEDQDGNHHPSSGGKLSIKKGGELEKGKAGRLLFADANARSLTKDKMRLCLRMAAARGHTMLVLGLLGCGAFGNPPGEVADCWLEVLNEEEFRGGWFKEIWFAVYDRKNEGNFEVFRETLDGKIIGKIETEGDRN